MLLHRSYMQMAAWRSNPDYDMRDFTQLPTVRDKAAVLRMALADYGTWDASEDTYCRVIDEAKAYRKFRGWMVFSRDTPPSSMRRVRPAQVFYADNQIEYPAPARLFN